MNILFVTSTFELNGGGISSYAHDFFDAFKNQHRIIIVTGDNYVRDKEDKFILYNIDLVDLSVKNAKRLIDIIEYENPNTVVNSNAMLLSCVSPFLSKEINLVSISHFVNGRLADIAGYNSTYLNTIISLSHYGKLYIEKKFGIRNKSKVSVVYNFLQTKVNNEILNQKKNRKILKLVYPGGGSIHKSSDFIYILLLKLLKSDFDFEFYWLGSTLIPGHAFSFIRMKDFNEIIPKDHRVILTGYIRRSEAISIIEDANIFLLPSRGEGCPISLLEAMRVGTIPIVSNSKHASSEIIQDGISGYICTLKNVDEIYERIINVLKDHDSYSFIYDNSNTRFLSLHGKEKWINYMNNIMTTEKSVINRNSFSIIYYFKTVLYLRIILFFDRVNELWRSFRYVYCLNVKMILKEKWQ